MLDISRILVNARANPFSQILRAVNIDQNLFVLQSTARACALRLGLNDTHCLPIKKQQIISGARARATVPGSRALITCERRFVIMFLNNVTS